MQTHEDEANCVCRECIENPVLASEVAMQGSHSRCSYCREEGRALPLGDLAERIHEVLQEHFQLTCIDASGLWASEGILVTPLISAIAGLSAEIADDVRELLSDRHGYSSRADGGDDPYGPDAAYEEANPNDLYFQDT